jgi:hypothetical protein
MKRNLSLMLLVLSIPSLSTPAVNEAHRLTIRVMDYAGLPVATLGELEANAQRVLRGAGVSVHFVECYGNVVKSGAAGCLGVPGSTDVILRILQPKFAVKGEQLGYAAMGPEGGAYVTIFVNLGEQKARVGNLTNGAFLGHAVAHEIGHLLLGANSHSTAGIMRPVWRPADEVWMAKGVLIFGEDEAVRMQMAIARLAGRD